jgi:hypothetical protein
LAALILPVSFFAEKQKNRTGGRREGGVRREECEE